MDDKTYILSDLEYQEFQQILDDDEEYRLFVQTQTAIVNQMTVEEIEEVIREFGWYMPEDDEQKKRLALWLLT